MLAKVRDGDTAAWKVLIERLKGVVWRATADLGLASEDREDVFATTFFRLFEHLGDIREPEKLPGWLATTARNEAWRVVNARRRLELRGDVEPDEVRAVAGVEERLLDEELRMALQSAFLRLGRPCQELLRLVTAVPPLSYDQISELTGIPRGSLGPTRQRCLQNLRRAPELRPFIGEARP